MDEPFHLTRCQCGKSSGGNLFCVWQLTGKQYQGKKITPFLLHSAVPAPLAVSLAAQHHHQECDATQCSVTALSVAQHRVTQRGDQLGGSADLAWDCPSLWALLQSLL